MTRDRTRTDRTGPVLIAPDKFKGSLSAVEVADRLRAGIVAVEPAADVRPVPVADGGEGTVEAVLASGFEIRRVLVTGPDGRPVHAQFAVRGDTAVVELAQASGLQLVEAPARRALLAGSYGTGQLISAALDEGCRTIVLGIGGSAGTDGGAGMAQALGVRLLDPAGQELSPGGGELGRLATVDLTGLDARVATTTFVIASDVDNVLLGPEGAATVFGPQKGAGPDQVRQLEAGLIRWSQVLGAAVGRDHSADPGAGAAGGVGFAARAVLAAEFRPGIQLLLEMTGFAALLERARLVVTGEGSLDRQSLGGKTPVGVARAAGAHGVPVVAVAGVSTLSESALAAAGFQQTYTLQQLEPDLARCMSDAGPLLVRIGRQIASDWLLG